MMDGLALCDFYVSDIPADCCYYYLSWLFIDLHFVTGLLII